MKRRNDITPRILQLYDRIDELQRRQANHTGTPDDEPDARAIIDDIRTTLDHLRAVHDELLDRDEEPKTTQDDLETQKRRYRDLFTFAPDPYLTTDLQGRVLEANDAATEMFGIEWDFLRRKPLATFIAGESRREFRALFEEIQGMKGRRTWELRIQPRHRPPFDAALTVALLHDDGGEPAELRWMIRDTSSRRQAEERIRRFHADLEQRVATRTAELEEVSHGKDQLLLREKAARLSAEELQSRFRFLAEAAEVMSSSLCYEATLQTVAHMAIPRLANWCFVDIVEEDGSIWRLAIATDSPARERLGRRLLNDYGPEEGAQNRLVANAIATGVSEILTSITDDLLEVIAQDSHHLALLKALGPTSTMVVPLVTRGRTLGAITFVATTHPPYTNRDLDLAEELAHRAAIAVDNARLYRRAETEIEERERIEERLRHSEARFRRIYQSDLISIAFFDLHGNITEANDAFFDMLGITREGLAGGQVRWDLLTPPEWMPRTLEALGELKEKGRCTPYEKECYRSDGSRFPALLGGAMIEPDEGVSFVLDLSRLKESERELQERMRQLETIYMLTSSVTHAMSLEEIYEEAMEGLHNALELDRASILLLDSDGIMRFKQARGLSPEYIRAVDGHSPWDAGTKHPEPITIEDVASAEELSEELRRAILKERIGALAFIPLLYEGNLLGKFMLYHNAPHHFEREELRVAETIASHVAFAIGRKRTEEALIRSENRFHTLIESDIIGIISSNIDGTITGANDEFLRMVGYSRDDLTSGRLDWRTMTPPEYLEQDARLADELRRTGHCTSCEKEYYRKDGSSVPVLLGIALVEPESGDTICFALDISDRKQAEIEMRGAKEQAEEASRAKDHFLAILSHELRTPLAPVLAAAQALEFEPILPEDLRPMVEIILRNANLQGRLIDDMLDLTRIVKGKLKLNMETVDVHEILRNVVQVCDGEMRTKGLLLRLDLAAETLLVRADPARLQQVFWNILRNSVKFTPPGGTITIHSVNDQGGIVVEVIDTGPGIEPADLDRIFTAFEQSGEDGSGRYGGLGLGLAISRALVDRQQGTLKATSAGRGRGSTFTVTLPTVATP